MCSFHPSRTGIFPEQAMLQMSRSALGQFEWLHEKKEYIADYRSIFLQGSFSTPSWTVVLSESKSDMLAPAANFKKIFPLVFLLSLWVVLFLSIVQIRRSLIPLEKLQEGTVRIAIQDFDSKVTIKSGDEFEELAASFNAMASQLGKQFNTMTMMNEIDHEHRPGSFYGRSHRFEDKKLITRLIIFRMGEKNEKQNG